MRFPAVLISSFLVASASSFTVIPQSTLRMPSTWLAAVDGEDAPEEPQPQKPAEAAATDILNSPAFLERKLDVLKSDIAKVDEEIASAKDRLESGKAEWGGQLDELQTEVRENRSTGSFQWQIQHFFSTRTFKNA